MRARSSRRKRGALFSLRSAVPLNCGGNPPMLHERYRPASWEEFAGNDKAVKVVRRVIERPGFDGGAIWIDGPSGIGKTSMAWLIAKQLTKSEYDVEEIDGDDCSVDRVRELSDKLRFRSLSGGFRAVIINESHAMTSRAVQAWLTLLERLPRQVIVIFTTTQGRQESLFGDFDGPLMSRCLCVSLTSYGIADAFAVRAQSIAQREGLDGAPIAKYKRLVSDCRNNLRAVLGEIELGSMITE
ncbi:AAA family ATPase [bacterium]|nr:AAA family ATPase [bacterium]